MLSNWTYGCFYRNIDSPKLVNRKFGASNFETDSLTGSLESPNLFLYKSNERVDDKETQTKRKRGDD
jgi:hypothetical protein